ncbi:MAG: sulfur carrier protein ThiS [Phycisphaerae bacterium]
MEIIVNGDKHDVPEQTTVTELLTRFKLPSVRVAVERNRDIVPRRLFAETKLAPGDQLEIVTFVGGG